MIGPPARDRLSRLARGIWRQCASLASPSCMLWMESAASWSFPVQDFGVQTYLCFRTPPQRRKRCCFSSPTPPQRRKRTQSTARLWTTYTLQLCTKSKQLIESRVIPSGADAGGGQREIIWARNLVHKKMEPSIRKCLGFENQKTYIAQTSNS